MPRPLISIAMCTFNGARFLGQQLESIAGQALLPDELVVCDDGSTDRTNEILNAFRRAAPFRVRLVVNAQRLGVTQNFEQAIRLCKGEIIFLADQDDVWSSNKMEVLAHTLESQPRAAYAFSDADVISAEDVLSGPSFWEMQGFSARSLKDTFAARQFELLLDRNVVAGCAMGFRANLKPLFLPIPAHWVHDYWIALIGSVVAYGIPISDRLLRYRKHPSQQIGVDCRKGLDRVKGSIETDKYDYWVRMTATEALRNRVAYIAQTIPCSKDRLYRIDQKARHLAVRFASQETSGLEKITMVLMEAFRGRYARFSGSWRSVIRDVCPRSFLNWFRKGSRSLVAHRRCGRV